MTASNARQFADHAEPTPTGVMLAARVYAHPNGSFRFTAANANEGAARRYVQSLTSRSS
jgi:hypothetical protein